MLPCRGPISAPFQSRQSTGGGLSGSVHAHTCIQEGLPALGEPCEGQAAAGFSTPSAVRFTRNDQTCVCAHPPKLSGERAQGERGRKPRNSPRGCA